MVNFLFSLYKSGTATVSYLGCKSKMFGLKQGVRQGSILSPHMYNIYNEYLLEHIVNNNVNGTSLYGVYTGIIAYADDILLLSSTKSGLQNLINTCTMYSNDNFIKINTDKTEFLLSGNHQIENCFINLSDKKTTVQTKLKHLGFLWDTNKSPYASIENLNINERIIKYQAVAHTLIRSGIRFTHPNTIMHRHSS